MWSFIKQLRSRLIESSSAVLIRLQEDAIGAVVVAMHTEICTRTGERIFMFSLDRDLEDAFQSV